jgi:hypothetical protein
MKTQNWAIILADQEKKIIFLLGLVDTFSYDSQILNFKMQKKLFWMFLVARS